MSSRKRIEAHTLNNSRECCNVSITLILPTGRGFERRQVVLQQRGTTYGSRSAARNVHHDQPRHHGKRRQEDRQRCPLPRTDVRPEDRSLIPERLDMHRHGRSSAVRDHGGRPLFLFRITTNPSNSRRLKPSCNWPVRLAVRTESAPRMRRFFRGKSYRSTSPATLVPTPGLFWTNNRSAAESFAATPNSG